MTAATTRRLYYDPATPSAFSTLRKLLSATTAEVKKKGKPTPKKKSVYAIRTWLENQDAYTFRRPLRKRFARNPFTVTNVMDVWECDLLDVQAYGIYNDNYRYILSVIDIFQKFLDMVPVKTKSGPPVASAFRSIFDNTKYSKSRRPLHVRTDKGKEFLNKHFQDTLRDEGGGIQFQVCRNPDLKCAVVERVHRMTRDSLYKYLNIKLPTDISMLCLKLSRLTMTRFTRQ